MVRAINIFVTDPKAAGYEPFDHGETRYGFEPLDERGPRRLIDGACYIFVDWVMQGLSGLEMCRRLRADPRTQDAHITLLLEADREDDKRRALRAGADDYLIGPLDRATILDRILALRQIADERASAQVIAKGELEIDLPALQIRWAGMPLTLPPNEFRLLRYFAENSDRVLSRDDLMAGLGKREDPIDERTVDVWVGRLRRALRTVGAGDRIRTIRSMGYVYDSR